MRDQLAGAQRGFSLVELLVSVALVAVVMIGFLSLFDTSAKISKAQSARADVQENLRYVLAQVVRLSRMPGAGGVPAVVPASSPRRMAAIDVLDNVGTGGVTPPTFGTRTPLTGTDVLTLRGAFDGMVVDLNTTGAAYTYDVGSSTGSVTVPPLSFAGESQADVVTRIADALAEKHWLPVMFTQAGVDSDALDGGRSRMVARYAMAILDNHTTGSQIFGFHAQHGSSDEQTAFLDLNVGGEAAYPTAWGAADMLRMVVIDQATFYVADDDDGIPTLYQFDPGTGTNLPMSSDIVDLQVALGCDRNRDGLFTENDVAGGDEWLFNVAGETLADTGPGGTVPMVGYLSDLRITVTGRIPVPDRAYAQKPFPNEDGTNGWLTGSYREVAGNRYRYVFLSELVRCRSLGPVLAPVGGVT